MDRFDCILTFLIQTFSDFIYGHHYFVYFIVLYTEENGTPYIKFA